MSKRMTTEPQLETVTMDQVPDPPLSGRTGVWGRIYQKIRALGLAERAAVKVCFTGHKEFVAARGRLRKLSERDGLRLCSSRNADSTEGYFWQVKG